MGHGLEQLIKQWVSADAVDAGVALFRERYEEIFLSKTQPLSGVAAALSRLHRAGYRMAIASNKPARFTRAILDQLNWSDWFVAVEGPDTVGATKPDPAMLRCCHAALGTPIGRTRYVGDMPLDVISARSAGFDVMLVAGGSASLEELESTAVPVLQNFSALLPFIVELGWPTPAP